MQNLAKKTFLFHNTEYIEELHSKLGGIRSYFWFVCPGMMK